MRPRRGGLKRALVLASLLCCTQGWGQAEDGYSVPLTTLNWAPYIGQELDRRGYVHAIVRQALARRGLRLEARFLPWARAYEMARKGEAAGVFPEYHDAARTRDFIFSDPFPGGPIGLYKRRGDPIRFPVDPRREPETVFRALRQLRFGVVRGYANTAAFDAADYLIKDEATSDAINLKKLAYGRVDLVVIDKYVAAHLLDGVLSEFAGDLVFMQPPLEIKPLYVAFSRAYPGADALSEAFNAGLAEMRADGSLDELLRDFGFSPRTPPPRRGPRP